MELKFLDGSMISIDTIAVESELPTICIGGQNWTIDLQ
ncbi:MAG: DUF6061 family protein [Hydrogeniiclostridium mannosilyticum]